MTLASMSRPCGLSPQETAQTSPCRLGWLTSGRHRWRRAPRPLPAPVAALHPPTLDVTAAAAAQFPLAAVVPEWPRIGGQVVRDWIGAGVDQLPGFSGDDEARLLFPDLVGLVDGPTFLISVTLFVAFVYWEGGVLLRALRERRQQSDQQQQGGRDDTGAALGSWDAGSPGEGSDRGWGEAGTQPVASEARGEQQRTQREELIDRARHERRRGLGLLALITAACIWMTGVVNSPSPFQP